MVSVPEREPEGSQPLVYDLRCRRCHKEIGACGCASPDPVALLVVHYINKVQVPCAGFGCTHPFHDEVPA